MNYLVQPYLSGKTRWEISESDVNDVVVGVDLAGSDRLDVSSGFGGKINDDRSGLHAVDHVLLDQGGSAHAWNLKKLKLSIKVILLI
jgi:hypothetical protein